MNNPPELTSCSNKKCSTRCDIVYVIVKYVTPLMQCLTNDIREYNMQLLTTKCLNTAVMLMFFMLGKRGLEHSKYCDSYAIVERHNKGLDNNAAVMKKMRHVILNKKVTNRYIYYILMNDGYFDLPNGEKVYFPGHVFILERVYYGGKPYFNLYQSYINKYDLQGYYTKNKTVRYTMKQIEVLIDKLSYITKNETWDDKCVQYWLDFTMVDTSNLRGSRQGGKLFICFSYEILKLCIENIKEYVKEKISSINSQDLSKVYGDPSYYRDSSVNPLTYGEMKGTLHNILFDIEKNKNHI